MIKSFGDKKTEKLYLETITKPFENVAKQALKKLDIINFAPDIQTLRLPPSNRLEKLTGRLKDFWSIRINQQWRIIFKWDGQNAHEVQIIDYH